MAKNINRDYATDLAHVLGELFTKLLIELPTKENGVSLVKGIVDEMQRYAKQQEHKIEIISAHELTPAELTMVKKHFGEDVIIKETIDTKILGGVIIKTKDTIFDGSVKSRLQKLSNKLK